MVSPYELVFVHNHFKLIQVCSDTVTSNKRKQPPLFMRIVKIDRERRMAG